MKKKWTGKIAISRNERYAPCCYILCKAFPCGNGLYDWNDTDEENTILVQCDIDFPGIARTFGWYMKNNNCEHTFTDGTVDCPDCGKNSCEFIAEAIEYLDYCVDNALVVDDPGYFGESGD